MKKILIFSGFLILTLGLIIGFILLNSKPDKLSQEEKEKAIGIMLGRKANMQDPNIKTKTGNTSFEGKFARFDYPPTAIEYKYKDSNSITEDPNTETFSFDIKSPRLVFNYITNKSVEVSLSDVPAVRFRQDSAKGYTQKEEKADGVIGLSFIKDRSGEYPAEKSTFFLHNGIIYSISISGSSLRDVEELSKQILSSFTFVN